MPDKNIITQDKNDQNQQSQANTLENKIVKLTGKETYEELVALFNKEKGIEAKWYDIYYTIT